MRFKGKLKSVARDWLTGSYEVTFTMSEGNAREFNGLMDLDLGIEAKKYRKSRSLDANALMWFCLGRIASALNTDKWEVYLRMLKRYGKFTYICVKPNAVEGVKQTWRECEEIGEVNINGQKAVQMLVYFGSSTYDTQEMTTLLNGILSEMHEMGLEMPTSEQMKRSLEEWEKRNAINNASK